MLNSLSILDSWLLASTSYLEPGKISCNASHCGRSCFLSQAKFAPASGPLHLLDGFLSHSFMNPSVTSVMSLLSVTLSNATSQSSNITTPQSPLSSFICLHSSQQYLPYCIITCLHVFFCLFVFVFFVFCLSCWKLKLHKVGGDLA